MFFKLDIGNGIIREYANIIHWDFLQLVNPAMKDDIIDMCNFYGELAVLKITDDDYMNPFRIQFSLPLFVDDKGKAFTHDSESIITPLNYFSINKSNFKDFINIFYNFTLEEQEVIDEKHNKKVKLENPFFISETIDAYNKKHFTKKQIMSSKITELPLHDERYLTFLETIKEEKLYDIEYSIRYYLSKYYFENVSGKLTDTPQEYFDWLNKNLE